MRRFCITVAHLIEMLYLCGGYDMFIYTISYVFYESMLLIITKIMRGITHKDFSHTIAALPPHELHLIPLYNYIHDTFSFWKQLIAC